MFIIGERLAHLIKSKISPETEARQPGQPAGDLPAEEPAPLCPGVLRHDGPGHHAEAQKGVTKVSGFAQCQ